MTGSRTQPRAEIGKRRRQRTLRLDHDRREESRVCRAWAWECNTLAGANQLQRLLVLRTHGTRTRPGDLDRDPVLTSDDQRLTRMQLLPAGVCLRRASNASCTVKGRESRWRQPHVIHAVLVDAVLRQECAQVSGRKSGIPRQHEQPVRRQAATSPDEALSDRSSSTMAKCKTMQHVRWQNDTDKNRCID
jgi:hypothetical protein